MKVFVKTFGCRTNIYDSQLIKEHLKDNFCNDENLADTIIINSCSVTNGADADVRNYINKMQDKKLIFTGCGFSSAGKNLQNQGKIFGIFAPANKHKILEFLKKDKEFFEDGNSDFVENHIIEGFDKYSKAFLKIQEGCDFSCSYCIIPSQRGKSRSMIEDNIILQAKKLLENGYQELVLTGTNIGSYGKDTNSSLGRLLQKLGSLNNLKRIRLGSIEPSQIDESFKEILDEDWIEKHLHIALQHTSQKMLNIMRRVNKAENDKKLFYFLASKGFALGTDYIVAHPGETEEIWQEGLENFKQLPITHLHAFIYSKRNGTKSANMKEYINPQVAKTRLNILKNITNINNYKFREKKTKLLVFCEKLGKDGYYSGFDQFYNKIAIKSNKNLSEKWLEIEDYEVYIQRNFATI